MPASRHRRPADESRRRRRAGPSSASRVLSGGEPTRPAIERRAVRFSRRSTVRSVVAVRVAALSLRVRVAILVAVVVGGTAVAISAATFFTIRAQYYREFDDNLYER